VPSDADFATLISYLGGDSVAGGKLKEVGIAHWDTPNTEATDDYGFSLLASGDRSNMGIFADIGLYGTMISSEDMTGNTSYYYGESTSSILWAVFENSLRWGFSVRMMRDVV
jgi:uncharacterized protein (TIGR02145 family)